MKRLVILVLTLLIFDLLFQQCANPKSPTGGPKDTIPPTLIESFPVNGAINFTGQELRLEFSEYINIDKLKQQLIITPKTDVIFKSVSKKNQLIIKFEEHFQDSTTYNLNFADGVTDITEKNPVINLSMAFSTGSFIDSMNIKGQVIDLFQQTPVKGYTVGLYPFSDTLDYFSESPIYFTTTNDSGNFQLNYIKSGNYKLLAFDDDNANILLDPETEAHGFIPNSIQLDSAITLSDHIKTILQNIKPLQLLNVRPSGPYVEIKFNKTVDKYEINPAEFDNNLIGETKDIIRLYRPESINYGDSTEIILTASDSLNNQTNDTLKIVFIESNRKPSTFTYSAASITKSLIHNQEIKVNFNKPIKTIDSTKLFFKKDSIFNYQINPIFNWNENKTELTLLTRINRDSLIVALEKSLPRDSTDTISVSETKMKTQRIQSIDFVIDDLAFISVENDTSEAKTLSIPLTESSSFGTIKFTIETENKSFNVQLLDSKDQPVYQMSNQKIFTFPKVTPANYKIRVLIDSNNDGKWSAGNLLLDEEPEEIYLYPESTSVRENWVLEIDLSF